MKGQLCTVGVLPNLRRLFYYRASPKLFVELIDRRNRDLKHLIVLMGPDGKPVDIPEGSFFAHVESAECVNLLENHVR